MMPKNWRPICCGFSLQGCQYMDRLLPEELDELYLPEFRHEELWDLHREQHTRKAKDNGVGECGDQYGGVANERKRVEELPGVKRHWVDPLEGEELLLEGRATMADTLPDVSRFRASEDIAYELQTVDLASECVSAEILGYRQSSQLTMASTQ